MNYSCQFLTFLLALGLGAHVEVDGLRSSMMEYRGGLINAQAELFMNGRVNMSYANMENPEEVNTVSQFLNIGNHYPHNGNSHYSQNGNNRFERNGNDHYSRNGNDHYSQNANEHYSQNGNVHYSQSGNDKPFASHDELFEMFEDSFERGFPVHEGSRRHYTGAFMP